MILRVSRRTDTVPFIMNRFDPVSPNARIGTFSVTVCFPDLRSMLSEIIQGLLPSPCLYFEAAYYFTGCPAADEACSDIITCFKKYISLQSVF